MIFLIYSYQSHVHEAVELHSCKVKKCSTSEFPLVSSSTKSSQDTKANTVELQDNPAYVVTNDCAIEEDYTYVSPDDYI